MNLFQLAAKGDVKGMRAMQKRGELEPNRHDKSSFSQTPLHFAAHGGHADACKFLIDAGGDAAAVTDGRHKMGKPCTPAEWTEWEMHTGLGRRLREAEHTGTWPDDKRHGEIDAMEAEAEEEFCAQTGSSWPVQPRVVCYWDPQDHMYKPLRRSSRLRRQ